MDQRTLGTRLPGREPLPIESTGLASTPHPVPQAAGLPPADLSEYCPRFHHAMEVVGRRWVGAILRVLLAGPHRFHAIQSAIPGISDRLLTERLRELEDEGIVVRHVYTERPVRVEYELSEKGRELEGALRDIAAWAEKWVEVEPEQ